MAYAGLPSLDAKLSVRGLVSPYRHKADAMDCTLDSLVQSYVAEMRRHQPSPPYNVGGWSAGGVLAYVAAQQLLDAGHEVSRLLLIDSPEPTEGLHPLPDDFYEACTTVGLFGRTHSVAAGTASTAEGKGQGPPPWLIPHFKATINLLADYRAPPLRVPAGMQQPMVSIVWAGRPALAEHSLACSPSKGLDFLTAERRDFGPGLWARLFARDVERCEVLHGWDHFGMMVSLARSIDFGTTRL